MKVLSAENALARIQRYLSSDIPTPFMVVVDNLSDYLYLTNELANLERICTSDFCFCEDAFPDIDLLYSRLLSTPQNMLLLGIGECVRLNATKSGLDRLKDLTPVSKVVILCRGIRNVVKELCSIDAKFNTERRLCWLEQNESYDIVKIIPSLRIPAQEGIKALLKHLEAGALNTIYVRTHLPLNSIREVRSAHEAIQQQDPTFSVPATCLIDSLWEEFLEDRTVEGYDLLHWRTFLKYKLELPINNKYLIYVIEQSADFESYKRLLFSALLDFTPQSSIFLEMYSLRKKLISAVDNVGMANYISQVKAKGKESLYYLTDNTDIERKAIVESLDGVSNIPSALEYIYPSLLDYLSDFRFSGEKGELFTQYFSDYKHQKVSNKLSQKFLNQVLELSLDGNRVYNSLKTRGEVLDKFSPQDSILYWIDALGAEFLGYIQSRVKSLNLRMQVHTVRANLPTITAKNSDFYESWQGKKFQTKQLDEVKHKGEREFNYESNKSPIHLVKELQIIDQNLELVASELAHGTANRVILASDHGASRLAVINEQECRWEMASKGKHSGRCCLCSEVDVKSEYATQENDFWVIANYDRFKGGRKASVEVHGGATLEEVIVPLIEFELCNNQLTIFNTTPLTTASFKKQAEVILYCNPMIQNVSGQVNGKRYIAQQLDAQNHKIIFPDIKKSGIYTVDIFEGDNLIGQVEFQVQRESGSTNDADWF